MNATKPDAEVVLCALEREWLAPVDIHAFDTLGSTSAWLGSQRDSMSALLDQGRAQLCITDWQQAGIGRRGKSWQTQPGNVTFSVLARHQEPTRNLVGLSLITGLAVAQALEDAFSVNVKLKWPNDVILADRKLGGLLTEVMTVSGSASAALTDVVTGIGINVEHDESVVVLGIGATSLRGAGIEVLSSDRDALIGRITAAVLNAHQQFLAEGWAAFSARWAERDWLMGKAVLIHRDEATEHAVACGVNEQGALLVERAGKILPLYGGNVSIRPTA